MKSAEDPRVISLQEKIRRRMEEIQAESISSLKQAQRQQKIERQLLDICINDVRRMLIEIGIPEDAIDDKTYKTDDEIPESDNSRNIEFWTNDLYFVIKYAIGYSAIGPEGSLLYNTELQIGERIGEPDNIHWIAKLHRSITEEEKNLESSLKATLNRTK